MHHTLCNFCKGSDAVIVLTGRDLLHGIPGTFTLVQCARCGLMYVNPQPTAEELETYYPEDYEAYVGTRQEQLTWLRRLDYRYGVEKRYRAIMRYISRPGRMLDVGCGTGAFLEGMREHGWEVVGIEPSARAASYAREELGIEVHNTSFEDTQLESESLDLVTMWNVLEHLHDPQQALWRIHQALRPEGLLVFAIPNTNSYDLRIFGRYWAGYDLPRHLYVYPPGTIEKTVASVGFQILKQGCIYGTYNALAYSARFWMNDRIRSDRVRRALTRVMLSLPARAIMMPLMRLVDLLDRGTLMTWFCRKEG